MGRPRNSERDRMSQVQVSLDSEWLTVFAGWASMTRQRVPDLIAEALVAQYGEQVELLIAALRAKDGDADAAAR